jgi:hypothetical protein
VASTLRAGRRRSVVRTILYGPGGDIEEFSAITLSHLEHAKAVSEIH